MNNRYHHGDLPSVLRSVTAELVAERGPHGYSLREVARRAGVSHAAPAHHFGDARGLLTSVAIEGFDALADALEAAAHGVDDAVLLLERVGRAYVRTALEFPGHFGVIFQGDLVDSDDPELVAASVRAYGELQSAIAKLAEQVDPELDVDTAATLCWSAMQGLVALSGKFDHVAERTGTAVPPLDELVAKVTAMLVHGFAARP
jgi:AcrR family transcriptional regulator